MASKIGNIVFDCANPRLLSDFWSDVLGYPHADFPPEMRAELLAAGLEPQFVVDQSKHADRSRGQCHLLGLGHIHRHWLFAKNMLAVLECKKGHLLVKVGRSRNTDEIDRIVLDGLAPVVGKMADRKLACGRFGILDRSAGDRNDTRVAGRQKRRYLYRFRKSCSDDPDPDCFFHY